MNQETINQIYACCEFIHKAEKDGVDCTAQREFVDNALKTNRTNLDVLDCLTPPREKEG